MWRGGGRKIVAIRNGFIKDRDSHPDARSTQNGRPGRPAGMLPASPRFVPSLLSSLGEFLPA